MTYEGGRAASKRGLAGAAALIFCACWSVPAYARQADAAPEAEEPAVLGDIIVTARKRQESVLKVPVVLTAIGGEKLDKLAVTDMQDLPKLVPGLTVGHALLSIGTVVAIRGVGTSSTDPGVDQSVSLNVDGLSLSQGLAFGSAMFDLQQIEVLKGPQALFYGKSSPGGVISLRTADPTDAFEVVVRAGYEFEAREGRGELTVSGPLGSTLKGRIAGMYSAGDGYFTNNAVATPGTGAVNPRFGREPRPRNYVVRGTLLWDPSADLQARLKVNLVRDRGIGAETAQLAGCPDGPGEVYLGLPFSGNDDCRLDRELNIIYMDPASFPGISNGGVPYLENKQHFGTLELNYNVAPRLTLSSTTAYYKLRSSSLVNTTHTTSAGPLLAVENRFRRREFTQELRLTSDFSGPLNFTLGGFYQDGRIHDNVIQRANIAYSALVPPAVLNRNGTTSVDIETYSLFGQLRWRLTEQLELAGGARWNDETRSQQVFNILTNAPVTVAVPRIHASNVSPEITLTYTPTDDLTFFASYKKGYKSGSFSIATVPLPGANNAFGDERVEGAEAGIKARLLDRSLLLNLAAYDYRYKGLQVGGIEPSTNGVPIIRTVNAGSARTYGLDFDAAFRPRSIEGLGLNASLNWNHGRYRKLDNVPCYTGQTIAQGCINFPNPNTGLNTAQDLSGTPLIRAPEWQASFGFDYSIDIGANMKMTVTNNNQYSSRFVTFLAVGRPGEDNYQRAYLKSDLSLALADRDDRWEVAVIGKNIGDKITSSFCSATNFAGGTFLGSAITGGMTSGPAGFAEKGCNTERGRSVWVRVTLRPFN
jgi:iron complex outermembrane receptor protein